VPLAPATGETKPLPTVTGAIGQFGAHGPVVGQIVIAGDAPGAVISGVVVSGNTITQSIPTGIILHANAPGDVITGTSITGNNLSLNNWGKGNGGPEPTERFLMLKDYQIGGIAAGDASILKASLQHTDNLCQPRPPSGRQASTKTGPWRAASVPGANGWLLTVNGQLHSHTTLLAGGLELVELPEAAECCGFGGAFSVKYEELSCAMGADKCKQVVASGAGVLTSGDASCLMHINGLAQADPARPFADIRVMHLAEILASSAVSR